MFDCGPPPKALCTGVIVQCSTAVIKFIDLVPLFNACREKEAFEKRSQQLEQGQWSRYPISKDDIHDQEKKKNRRTVRQRTAEAKYLPNASVTADKYWPNIVGHHALWDDAYSVDPVCNRNLVVHTRSVKSLDENEYFNTNY